MTGGQSSPTSPPGAKLNSGFLNQLETPQDICQVAASAGAQFAIRESVYNKDLPEILEKAIRYDGFAVVDIQGICTGRFTKHNRITPISIEQDIAKMQPVKTGATIFREYGSLYRECALKEKKHPFQFAQVSICHKPLSVQRHEIIILGNAGQRIVTAGEILGFAGISAGLHVTQRNETNVTVLRGHSIAEVIRPQNPPIIQG